MTDAALPQKKSLPLETGHVGTLGGRGHKKGVASRSSTCKGMEGKARAVRERVEGEPREGERARETRARPRGTPAHGEAHRGLRVCS